MRLQLEKPLAIFDLEATGLNITKERIVQIAILKINPDGSEEKFESLINPEIHISEEVTKIHGIKNEDVANAPTFKEISEKIVAFIENADLAGYNSNKFDIPLLAEELLRVGSSFDISTKKFIDVQNIFHKMEQRTLVAALKFYCNQELVNAHDAMSDTTATWEVLKAQLERYPELEGNIDFLSKFTKNGNTIDFAGRLAYNDKNEAIYNFGKHKGKTVKEVNRLEPGYYSWFISPQTDFPLYTKQKLKEIMDGLKAVKTEINTQLTIEDKLAALQNKFKK
ncbi:MAG: exonuclease domain-containing protein [Crocinitomicaceae bacterium]|jgi:DNA polymerase-3 subunit epsilon